MRIFLKYWWLLLMFILPGSTWEEPDLDLFNGFQDQGLKGGSSSVDQLGSLSGAAAAPEPQNVWSPSFAELDKQQDIKKKDPQQPAHSTLDDMLASFDQTPVHISSKDKGERAWQMEADAWYRDVTRASALKKRSESKQQAGSVRQERSDYVIEHPEMSMDNKAKPKYKEWSNEAIIQKHEGTQRPPQAKDAAMSLLDLKLKQEQKMLSDQESFENQKRRKTKDVPKREEGYAGNLPDFGTDPVPDGVYERTLNRLSFSHPKTYNSNQKPFNNSPDSSRSSSLENDDFIKQTKRSSSSVFNPMDDIKLKTSIRLMRKGFGPMLPSSSLDIPRNRKELRRQQYDFGQKMKTFNPQDSSFDYIQSNYAALNVDQMMDPPNNYNMRMPQYDPLDDMLDYEGYNHRSSDLDRFKREPGLGTSSLGAQDNSNLKSLSKEAVGKPALKPFKQENKIKPFEGEEDLKVTGLGQSYTKEDSTKELKSKEEKLKDGYSLTKSESKPSAVEGKGERKAVSDFEAKLLELDAADGIIPSKSEAPAKVPNSEVKYDFNSKSGEVAKEENDDDMLKANINPKEPEAKYAYEDASVHLSYPDAVVKIMVDEMSHSKNRSKRHAQYLGSPRHGRRSKRSLDENGDNDSLAHVYDPTKFMVPMMNQRPQEVSPPQRQEFQQQLQLQPPLQPQLLPQLQQLQANRQPIQISDFKASFNLNNLFNEIEKMQTVKPDHQQDHPKLPVTKQPSEQQPVQKSSTLGTTKPTSSAIKSFGIKRFFGPFFRQSNPTINPSCVPITSPDGNSTTPEPASSNPPDNVCDNPESVKVNVCINANVIADAKTKQFCSNGSIVLQNNNKELPPSDSSQTENGRLQGNKVNMDADMDKDKKRHAPDINEWHLKTGMKQRKTKGKLKRGAPKDQDPGRKEANTKQTYQKVTPNIVPKVASKWHHPPETQSDSYERLISGQLSKDIVAAVFEAVRNDPELAMLLPILERNLRDSPKPPPPHNHHYQVRKEKKTESSFENSQTCIPIRQELQQFYDLILKTEEDERRLRKVIQDEVLGHVTGEEYTPRFVKLQETVDSLMESGQH